MSKVDLHSPADEEPARRGSVAQTDKNRWERLWPVIACGAGLFSDGYLNNVSSAQMRHKLCSDMEVDNRTREHDVEHHIPCRICFIICPGKCL